MRSGMLLGVVGCAMALWAGTASGAALVSLGPSTSWTSPPVFATAPRDDPRLFVVERAGTVRIVKNGVPQPTPFLTVPNVDVFSERGLLSIAFAPDYASTGIFYAFYTAGGPDAVDPAGVLGDVRVVEYRRSPADPDRADPASARLVLKQAHSAGNHNGGQLAFGPDGLLYVTIGDGATASNAQSLGNLLGKVLRVDPRDPDGPAGPQSYSIPPSNPFVTSPGGRPEIFTFGLRNPFRASFSPSGALVVGDVGSGQREEVDAGDLAGKNLGWPVCEGFCGSPNPAFTEPVFDYPHPPGPATTTGCAVIGGYVVRDPDLAGLTGRYLYGDLCAADLRTLDIGVAGPDPRPAGMSLPGGSLQSFGEDAGGCVYALTDQTVFRVAPDAGSPRACPRSSLPVAGQPGGPPGTGPGQSLVDRTRPVLRLRAGRQPLRRYFQLFVRCNEACTVRARGVLRFSKGAQSSKAVSRRMHAVSRQGRAHTRVRLRLTLKPALVRRARTVLRRAGRVTAHVRVAATDRAGNRTSRTLRVRLIRPKR